MKTNKEADLINCFEDWITDKDSRFTVLYFKQDYESRPFRGLEYQQIPTRKLRNLIVLTSTTNILNKMDLIPEDMIEEVKLNFKENFNQVINQLAFKFSDISSNTEKMLEAQMQTIETLCDEVNKGIAANDEFTLHCDILLDEFDGIENLAMRVREMRRSCEELEKKLNRIKI